MWLVILPCISQNNEYDYVYMHWSQMNHVSKGGPWNQLNQSFLTLPNIPTPVQRPLITCGKLQVAHAPGMPGTFSPPPRVSDPNMHHGTCVTHVPWCTPGSLNSGFLWRRWRENVPFIPGACATHNFPCLVRGPCTAGQMISSGVALIFHLSQPYISVPH